MRIIFTSGSVADVVFRYSAIYKTANKPLTYYLLYLLPNLAHWRRCLQLVLMPPTTDNKQTRYTLSSFCIIIFFSFFLYYYYLCCDLSTVLNEYTYTLSINVKKSCCYIRPIVRARRKSRLKVQHNYDGLQKIAKFMANSRHHSQSHSVAKTSL